MFATLFHFVPPQVALAIDVIVLAVVGPSVWLWRRHQANARRDLPIHATGDLPVESSSPADTEASDDKVLVGAR